MKPAALAWRALRFAEWLRVHRLPFRWIGKPAARRYIAALEAAARAARRVTPPG